MFIVVSGFSKRGFIVGGFWTPEIMQERLPVVVSPFDPARISHSSYELRMGAEAYVTGSAAQEAVKLAEGERVVIPPGQFAHLLAEEELSMPDYVLGLISIKFGLKRRGLINVSGFHVDPGFCGKLLFSVYNAGPAKIVISRGSPAFLLWFCAMEGRTAHGYDSKSNSGSRLGQAMVADDDIMALQGEVLSPQALAVRVEELEHSMTMWRTAIVTIGSFVVIPIIVSLTVTYWDKIVRIVSWLWPG